MKKQKDHDLLKTIRTAIISKRGGERLNPIPLAVPNPMPPESLTKKIKRMVEHEVSMVAEEHDKETWEEANDFDIEDEFYMDELEGPYRVVDEEYLEDLGAVGLETAKSSGNENESPSDANKDDNAQSEPDRTGDVLSGESKPT